MRFLEYLGTCRAAKMKPTFIHSALYLFTLSTCTLSTDRQQSRRPASLTKTELKKLAMPEPKIKFEEILDPILIPRAVGTDNNRKVAEFIKNYLKKLGWTVTTDAFEDETPYGKKSFENIIATLNPKTPRRLMLSCHFDSKYFENVQFDAATDSAVPCAMLLHLVASLDTQLQAHKNSEDREVTLQLVFFDGEEAFKEWTDTDSIYGSRHLAALWEKTPFPPGSATTELNAIDLMVLLDLLGERGPTIPNYFKNTKQWHDDLRAIEKTLREGGMWAGKGEKPYFKDDTLPNGPDDDHKPFLKRGVSILHLIPVPFPDVWHKPSDKKSALNFDTIENFNMVMRLFVCRYLHLPGFSGAEKTPSLPGMSKSTRIEMSHGVSTSAVLIGALVYYV